MLSLQHSVQTCTVDLVFSCGPCWQGCCRLETTGFIAFQGCLQLACKHLFSSRARVLLLCVHDRNEPVTSTLMCSGLLPHHVAGFVSCVQCFGLLHISLLLVALALKPTHARVCHSCMQVSCRDSTHVHVHDKDYEIPPKPPGSSVLKIMQQLKGTKYV